MLAPYISYCPENQTRLGTYLERYWVVYQD